MATPPRQLAFRILLELERDRATLADLLSADDVAALETRERGLLHELVLGVLRWRGALDHALTAHLDRPLERVDLEVITALRLGAHQLLNLRVPDHAAVAESVELVRRAKAKAAGFANAVLRGLARDGPPVVPDPARDPLAWLTSAGSLPAWLAKRWLGRLGAERAVRRARGLLAPAPTAFRLNPRHQGADELVKPLAPVPLRVPGAWLATQGRAAPLADEGVVYIQDEGSQLVAQLAVSSGRVLDACASPGGKATLIADRATHSRVVAGEPPGRRLATLARLVTRWGSPNVRVVGADAARPPFPCGSFDCVLLDAPCSGLGTLGRHPDARWRTREPELARHAALQRKLLSSLATLVKPGGRLVYATCSSEPEENEEVVATLLERPEFALEALPGWALPFADGGFARSGEAGGDSFFAATLRRA